VVGVPDRRRYPCPILEDSGGIQESLSQTFDVVQDLVGFSISRKCHNIVGVVLDHPGDL
jgi:hypothetical protein